MKHMKSDDEVIKFIKEYRAKHPDATRTKIFKAAGIGEKRFNDMIARKLIEVPAQKKTGSAWRSFVL